MGKFCIDFPQVSLYLVKNLQSINIENYFKERKNLNLIKFDMKYINKVKDLLENYT